MRKINLISMFLLFFLILPAESAIGEYIDKITNIYIVTPEWKEQTDKDGNGLFFEIVKNVYDPEGIKMKYDFFPWKRTQKIVSLGQADAMLCVSKEDASKKGYLLPKYPMFVEYTAVVFKKETIKNWTGIKNFNGKHAVWLRGYDYHNISYLKDIFFERWDEVDNYKQTWTMLEKGRVDFYIDAFIDINKYIKSNNVDMTPYRVEILWGEKTYMGFSKSERSKKLLEIFDKQIIKLVNSGKLKKIYNKWDVKYPTDVWPKKIE